MSNYNHQDDWFYEGQVSKRLVQYLVSNGYRILKDNSDNPRARGEDIIAIDPDGIKEIIEVKGYPTEFYTGGLRKGESKPTRPKLQAKHWFSEAILSSIFNYKKHRGEGQFILVLAFPLMERYKELVNKVEDYFSDNRLRFKIYFIESDGRVTTDDFSKPERK